jgi:adenosylcobinamide kinase/adenosylcobinamide-phosphate guanylyltransferase
MSKIILFTGGARSGKSTRAEQYTSGLSNAVVYIATAEARDDEMRHRIKRHQQRRPLGWRTLEAPLSVAASLATLEQGAVVLLDCVSLLVSNLLLAHEADPEPAIQREIEGILATGRKRDLTLVIVTNEVGMGIVPAYPLGRVYRDLLGWSNQWIASAADEVYMVICGIPVELRELEATWARK